MDQNSASVRSESPSVFAFSTAAAYLEAVFRHRLTANPAYGANAFARRLGVSAAMVSLVFAGRRSLSRESGEKIAVRLKLSSTETEYFLGLVELAQAKTDSARRKIRQGLRGLKPRKRPLDIAAARFGDLGRWETMAILEIAFLRPIRPAHFEAIAKRLRIGRAEVEVAVRELHAANLLFLGADGKYRRPRGELQIEAGSARREVDAYHRDVLRKAADEVAKAELAERVYSSNFFTFAKKDLGYARERIYRLLDELHDLSLNAPKTDTVYGLSLGMFKVFETGANE